MSKRPWVDGPWHAEFRHIVGHSDDKNHPMRSWPDCTGKCGDGEWDCDDKDCEFSEDCKGEWEEFTPRITVTYLKNPGKMTQGDQVVHPIVDANAQLIALAPEMAEIILSLAENGATDWCFMPYGEPCEGRSCSSCKEMATTQELASRLQKIIDQGERHKKWKAEQKDKNDG